MVETLQEIWRAEVEFLSRLASAPFIAQSIAQIQECDWSKYRDTLPELKHDDTQAILHGLVIAAGIEARCTGFAARLVIRAVCVVTCLRSSTEWRPECAERAISGQWGPGPLSVLLCRLKWNSAALTRAVERVIKAHAKYEQLKREVTHA